MVTLDNSAADEQSYPHTGDLGGEERIKQPFCLVGIDASSRILNGQAYAPTLRSLRSDGQLLRAAVDLAHRVNRVLQQIQNDLLNLDAIGWNQRKTIGKFQLPDHAASLEIRQRKSDRLSCCFIQVHQFSCPDSRAKERAQSHDYIRRAIAVANRALSGFESAGYIWRVGRLGGLTTVDIGRVDDTFIETGSLLPENLIRCHLRTRLTHHPLAPLHLTSLGYVSAWPSCVASLSLCEPMLAPRPYCLEMPSFASPRNWLTLKPKQPQRWLIAGAVCFAGTELVSLQVR